MLRSLLFYLRTVSFQSNEMMDLRSSSTSKAQCCHITITVTYNFVHLLQDSRSNTWPQQLQQPWSQSHLGAELMGSHDQSAYHRPISMQMSDPLSRRNIWQNTGKIDKISNWFYNLLFIWIGYNLIPNSQFILFFIVTCHDPITDSILLKQNLF
jgi:hypothetical protein